MVIFLTAEYALLEARFRPHLNLVNPVYAGSSCKRIENSSELNSHFGKDQGTYPSKRWDKLK